MDAAASINSSRETTAMMTPVIILPDDPIFTLHSH